MCSVSILSAAPSQLGLTAKWLGELSLSHSTDSVSGRTAHSVTCTVTQAVNRAGAHSSETCMCADTGGILEEREAAIYLLHQPTQFLWSYPVADASWQFDYISMVSIDLSTCLQEAEKSCVHPRRGGK